MVGGTVYHWYPLLNRLYLNPYTWWYVLNHLMTSSYWNRIKFSVYNQVWMKLASHSQLIFRPVHTSWLRRKVKSLLKRREILYQFENILLSQYKKWLNIFIWWKKNGRKQFNSWKGWNLWRKHIEFWEFLLAKPIFEIQ